MQQFHLSCDLSLCLSGSYSQCVLRFSLASMSSDLLYNRLMFNSKLHPGELSQFCFSMAKQLDLLIKKPTKKPTPHIIQGLMKRSHCRSLTYFIYNFMIVYKQDKNNVRKPSYFAASEDKSISFIVTLSPNQDAETGQAIASLSSSCTVAAVQKQKQKTCWMVSWKLCCTSYNMFWKKTSICRYIIFHWPISKQLCDA